MGGTLRKPLAHHVEEREQELAPPSALGAAMSVIFTAAFCGVSSPLIQWSSR